MDCPSCRIVQKSDDRVITLINRVLSSHFVFSVEDGQHLYMHSINIRSLIKEYGSLDKCPPTIQARIVAVEHMSIDQVIDLNIGMLMKHKLSLHVLYPSLRCTKSSIGLVNWSEAKLITVRHGDSYD